MSLMEKNHQKLRWWGISLGVASILTRWLLGNYPQIIESIYSRGIFLGIRMVLDSIQSILPIPGLYLLIILVLFIIIRKIIRIKKMPINGWQKLGQALFALLSFIGWTVFLFLVLWGFNYGRVPLEKQIGINPVPLTVSEVKQTISRLTPQLVELRKSVANSKPDDSFTDFAYPPQMNQLLQNGLEEQLKKFNYPTTGFPRLRFIYPKGFIWRSGAAGFYLPFTGECNVDPALHPTDQPYVVAHEYAHAYGFGDEGSCNFLAYLTCLNSRDPFIQYSGVFNYWQYLYFNLRKSDPDYFKLLNKNLDTGIATDLRSIRENADQYPDFLPTAVRRATYDTFLKTQGVTDGIASYNRVVMLVAAWESR